ncbi:hypothetical protein M758_UG013700 [Ceratodon purpureus]|nr:hypothetical protein M758_UG013700 [Ceratodon purpureus]
MAFKAALEKLTNNAFLATLKEAKRTGNLARILVDGNLLHTKLREHDATLIGEDTQGNKYFEKKVNTQFGRHRWVVYADSANYNASAIPPEWHAWLHYITDHTAEQLLELKPTRYGVAHRENLTGRGDGMVYHTKGHALNPNKRDWKRYQSWQPENPDSERKSSETTPNSV